MKQNISCTFMSAPSSMPNRQSDQQLQQLQLPLFYPPKHVNVFCDRCKTNPINGTRFKCGTCSNYDLCKWCFDADHQHDETHIFLVIKKPFPPEFNDNTVMRQQLLPNLYTIANGVKNIFLL